MSVPVFYISKARKSTHLVAKWLYRTSQFISCGKSDPRIHDLRCIQTGKLMETVAFLRWGLCRVFCTCLLIFYTVFIFSMTGIHKYIHTCKLEITERKIELFAPSFKHHSPRSTSSLFLLNVDVCKDYMYVGFRNWSFFLQPILEQAYGVTWWRSWHWDIHSQHT